MIVVFMVIEYGSIFYYHKDYNHQLQTLQNKFLRLATNPKLSSPIDLLELLTKLEPLDYRIQYLLGRLWIRAKYSPQYHPLNKAVKIFDNTMHQIYTGKMKKYRPNAKSQYMYSSPLHRAQHEYQKTALSNTNIEMNFSPKSIPISSISNYLCTLGHRTRYPHKKVVTL